MEIASLFELEDRLNRAVDVLMSKFDIDEDEARELALAEDEELAYVFGGESDIELEGFGITKEDKLIVRLEDDRNNWTIRYSNEPMSPGWRAFQHVQDIAEELEEEGHDIEWGVVETIGYNYQRRIEEGALKVSDMKRSTIARNILLNSKRKITGERFDDQKRAHHEIPISFGEEDSGGSPDPVAVDINKDTGEENIIPLPGDYDNVEGKLIAEEFLEDMQTLWEGGRGPEPEQDYTLIEAIELEYGDVPDEKYYSVKMRLRRFRKNHLSAFDLQEILQEINSR